MVTLQDFKKALGTKADNLSEEQLTELNNLFDRFAGVLFDSWIKDTKSKTENDKLPQ
jgi:hypothetical protein